ncbi:RING-H2 finger protein ATL52-like [Abrus precatorius]|uniref:RING-type E3 ubiquitin transferase n=1 Tax=Abrus precatorius TaxID=3816 RepID=A0A8B8M6Y3_ABRPR|nr:RING-H2 finger protein ATL52-like [Abrus precatorius]
MDDDDGHSFANNVIVILIAMGSAAFVVSTYQIIATFLCNKRIITDQNPSQQQHPLPTITTTTSFATQPQMIPTHKYHKKKVDNVSGDGDEGDTCAVCLGDFEEGEELRTMPECLHYFHVPCIDIWLSSHSSCPVCRASATPSLEMLHSNHDHSIDMAQFGVAHSEFVIRR